MKRSLRCALAATAITAIAGTSAFAGVELAPSHVVTRVVYVGPAECHSPTLPSGDAISVDRRTGNAFTPPTGAAGTVDRVCTDGVWVDVAGYGNPRSRDDG